jgi:steroid delta-isomerase
MPLSATQIRELADGYIAAINSRDADEIVKVVAADVTFEDPVGSPPHHGRDAVRALFEGAAQTLGAMKLTRVSPISVATNHAAFALLATIELTGATMEMDIVDVVTFGDDGLITHLQAFWSYDEVRALA